MVKKLSDLFTKYLTVTSIVGIFLIPSALLLAYSIVASSVARSFINGLSVNYVFFTDLTQVVSLVLVVSVLMFVLVWIISPHPKFVASPRTLSLSVYVLMALLSISPIIGYVIANLGISTPFDILVIFANFIGLAAVFIVLIPYILGKYASDRMLLSTVAAFSYISLNMASITQSFNWLEAGSTPTQFGLFGVVLILIWMLLGTNKSQLAFIIIVFIGGNTIPSLMPLFDGQPEDGLEETLVAEELLNLSSAEPQDKPDIYLLIYDSYVSSEVMLQYGIDNSEQERYLSEQSFTFYPQTYSIGTSSLSSMNTVLNLSAKDPVDRLAVSGSGLVHQFLGSLDYQVMGLFSTDYFFRGLDRRPAYDYYTPPQSELPQTHELLTGAVWIGEFRYDLTLPNISRSEYESVKQEVFSNEYEDPLFVYAHSMQPGHSQNSGQCRTDEVDKFESKLQNANQEMTQDIDTILANNPNAIIIVAGDHGPYLTKNCMYLGDDYYQDVNRLDLQDRHGAFLAIRWAAEDFDDYDQIRTLQDVFPAIFAWMYRDMSVLDIRLAPTSVEPQRTAGVIIDDGIIVGGVDDGEPLYP